MKTAMAILEQTGDPRTRRLAQTMVDQLIGDHAGTARQSAWPAVGKRRSLDELGIAAERSLSDEVFMEWRIERDSRSWATSSIFRDIRL